MIGRCVAEPPAAFRVAVASSEAFFWIADSRSITSAGVSLMMSAYEKNERRRGDAVEVAERWDGIADATDELSSAGIPPGIVSVTSTRRLAPLRGSSESFLGVIVASVSRLPNIPSTEGAVNDGAAPTVGDWAPVPVWEVATETGLLDLRGRIGLGTSK